MIIALSRRLGTAVFTVFCASLIAFAFMRILPGDPARLILGEFASDEAVERQREILGIGEPIWDQYVIYIRDFFSGNWGFSYTYGEPVFEQFMRALPATLELSLMATTLACLAAIIGAVAAAHSRGGAVDTAVRASSYAGLGTASFWFALLLLMIFFEGLGWLPGPGGRLGAGVPRPETATGFYTIDALLSGNGAVFVDSVRHLVLPTVALAFMIYAFLVRMVRASMLEITREPFVLVARGKGRTRLSALIRDALPNAMLPTITTIGLIFAELLTSSILVESVFGWPGIGTLITTAISQQDFAVVQAFVLISACLTVFVTAVVDALYGFLDPRVRSSLVRTGRWNRR